MARVKIDANAFVYPMPIVLIGATVENRANFMAVAWVSRVNARPPMIGIALGKTHYTNAGIHQNKTFSVNVPGMELLEKVDYCGLVSGKNDDKSKLFDIFYGELPHAPMIQQCPLCMECKLVTPVDLATNTFFIGEIMGAYADERFLTDGKPDSHKMIPFTLTMPDNNYWGMGNNIGKAWSIGNNLKTKK